MDKPTRSFADVKEYVAEEGLFQALTLIPAAEIQYLPLAVLWELAQKTMDKIEELLARGEV